MKRYLIGFFLLLVLAAGLLAGTSLTVNSRRDRVEVREEVFFGDREAAEGLTVGLRTRYASYIVRDGLTWHTRFTLDEGDVEPETDFVYDAGTPALYWDQLFENRSSLRLETWGDGSSSSGGPVLAGPDTVRFDLRDLPVWDVAERTEAGQRRTEVVPLSDYYDSIPWDLTDRATVYVGETKERIERQLAELFRVPVEPDYYLLVTVGKNSAGQIVEYGVFPADAPQEPVTSPRPADGAAVGTDEGQPAWQGQWDTFENAVCLADTEAGIWIYPSIRNEAGEEMVTYRDGPGVYLLPRISPEKFQVSNGSVDPESLDLDEARLVYATDALPLYMCASSDGSRLLLWTSQGGRLFLTVIDTATGQAERVTDLLPIEDGQELQCTLTARNGLYLVTLDTGDLVLTAETEHGYDAVLRTHVDMDLAWNYTRGGSTCTGRLRDLFHGNVDLAWDGTRLAVCRDQCQTVLVADAAGLRFLALYDYSPLWDAAGAAAYDWYYDPAMTVAFE